MKKQKPTLFFDMDGVLADFYSDSQCLEKMNEEGYFANLKTLPTCEQVNRLVNEFSDLVDVYVLSACVEPFERVAMEKIDWLDRNIPNLMTDRIILVKAGENKFDNIPPDIDKPYLFDDFSKNLYQWEERGGISFKIKNDINLKSGKSYRVVFNNPTAEEILKEVI